MIKDNKARERYEVLWFFICAIIMALVLTGCGHNTAILSLGSGAGIGIDPQQFSITAKYYDGLSVTDISRENSSWELDVDQRSGISWDKKTGTIKGVRKIKRDIGPQITGRLVELFDKDPEMAKKYIEAISNYWKYKAGKTAESK